MSVDWFTYFYYHLVSDNKKINIYIFVIDYVVYISNTYNIVLEIKNHIVKFKRRSCIVFFNIITGYSEIQYLLNRL